MSGKVTLPFLLLFSVCFQLGILLAIKFDHPQDLNDLKFLHSASEFSSEKEYDYIVVGGGTAGCPLAATLSKNYSVLLLERGGIATLNELQEVNIQNNLIQANDNDSIAEFFRSEDGIPNWRGRVLGGSSMINVGIYSRAEPDFYPQSGIEWDMDVVKKAYEWVEESIVTRADRLDTWQISVRDAMLEAGCGPNNGYSLEHLVGVKVSGNTFDNTGTKRGAAELLKKANPKNLQVVIHATVERVIFSSSKSGLRADGVIYSDSVGKVHRARVRSKGEVILSAGALGSPQLLLLSGVGPKAELASLNISVVLDQPFVGKVMIDNPRNGISVVAPFPFPIIGARVVGISRNGTFFESLSAIDNFFSPASIVNFPSPYPPLNLTVVTLFEKLSRPLSNGSLRLVSPTNVKKNPTVRFNYFSIPSDLSRCVKAMREIGKVMSTSTMEKYKFQDKLGNKYFKFVGNSLPKDLFDNESMERLCRDSLATIYHYHGGCLVGKVVDSHLRVKGIDALRIVDGSTFAISPGTNPQATVMMFGRHVGLKIQEERMAKGGDS